MEKNNFILDYQISRLANACRIPAREVGQVVVEKMRCILLSPEVLAHAVREFNKKRPTVVEAILDGKYPAHLTMKDLMEPFPVDWSMQGKIFLQPK